MKVMVVGGGGREHAIVRSLAKNPQVEEIFALPGNGGIAKDATCVDIGATDIPALVEFAVSHDIDLAVVAPDDPLVLGAVDALEAAGIPAFGPNADAAIIEGSKVFAKDLMARYNIPTAAYRVFDNAQAALDYLEDAPIPTVIKADGLALGKGVIIAQTRQEAKNAVLSMMEDKVFGSAGNQVVVEEFLEGPEVSVLAFTDGKTLVPMVSSMDHKRAFDGDLGPNTGGMGAVAPNPHYSDKVAKTCAEQIFTPTIQAMADEGRPFKGCLYFGLMLTKDGPKVIEYNARFGDPEAQVVLPLLETDLLTVMEACRDGRLDQIDVSFRDDNAACVVVASEGYPGAYAAGKTINIDPEIDADVFVAGARLDDQELKTSGGRVLGVTATAPTLEEAIDKAYAAVQDVSFDGAFHRSDIGAKALMGPEL